MENFIQKMKSLNQKSNYRKGKSVINDNKLECKGEYKLNEINMKRINSNNTITKNMLNEIQKVQKTTNDELYEFKNKNPGNKLSFKNVKSKTCENENTESNVKLNIKDNTKNNIKKNIHYKDMPLTAFFK